MSDLRAISTAVDSYTLLRSRWWRKLRKSWRSTATSVCWGFFGCQIILKRIRQYVNVRNLTCHIHGFCGPKT